MCVARLQLEGLTYVFGSSSYYFETAHPECMAHLRMFDEEIRAQWKTEMATPTGYKMATDRAHTHAFMKRMLVRAEHADYASLRQLEIWEKNCWILGSLDRVQEWVRKQRYRQKKLARESQRPSPRSQGTEETQGIEGPASSAA